MTYAGLQFAGDQKTPHLGGNITIGDPFTFCPSVWDYLVQRFAVDSVLDLGSGAGTAAWFFHNKGLKVVAIDGLAANVRRSRFPAVLHDLTQSPLITRVDLVHCQEVVEHIEEQYLENLISSLLSGKIIVMTHALPGQGGHHHVNLQPSEYWINEIEQRGGSWLQEDTRRVRELAQRDNAVFMATTGLVFANTQRF